MLAVLLHRIYDVIIKLVVLNNDKLREYVEWLGVLFLLLYMKINLIGLGVLG